MTSGSRELYEIEDEIRTLGLSICASLRGKLPEGQLTHLQELFSANEYGEAVRFLDWLQANEGFSIAPESKNALVRVSSLMKDVAQIFERRKE